MWSFRGLLICFEDSKVFFGSSWDFRFYYCIILYVPSYLICVSLCSLGSIFPSCKPSETVFKITFWLGYLNSCINPIIYPCFSREFKTAFYNVLRGRCLTTAKPQGHITCHSSSSGQTSNTSDPSVQKCVAVSSWCCYRALSPSSSSVGGPDQGQSAQIQSKSLLKAWCFSASQTPVPQNPSSQGSTKILRISLGITGEDVWLAYWGNVGFLSIQSWASVLPWGNSYVQLLHIFIFLRGTRLEGQRLSWACRR